MSVPFIQLSSTGQFELSPSCVPLLQSLSGRIVPIVVAGRYRGGKSSLLNFLVKELQQFSSSSSSSLSSSSFAVGSSIKSVTRGLHLCAQPIIIQGNAILLIDSEGLNSTNQTSTFDTQIFSLSVLLSSLFVLNSTGVIDEASLEQLELVVNMTEKVAVTQGHTGAKDLAQLAQHFPGFLWLLRDFALDLEYDGRTLTPNEYLQQALESQKGSKDKNRVRETIKSVFPVRECFPLVRPTNEESQLRNVSALPLEQLRPQFRQQIKQLVKKMLDMAKPKEINGQFLNGPAFLALARNYVDAFNHGAIPTIMSAWQNVVEIQGKELAESIIKDVQASANKCQGQLMEETEVRALFSDWLDKARQRVEANAVGSQENKSKITEDIKHKMEAILEHVMEIQRMKSHESCRALLDSLWAPMDLEGRVQRGAFKDAKELIKEIEKFARAYHEKARGAGKETRYREFFDGRISAILSGLYSALQSAQQDIHAARANEDKLKAAAQSMQVEFKALQHEFAHFRDQAKADKQAAQSELAALRSVEKELNSAAIEKGRMASEIKELVKQQAVWAATQKALEDEREKRIRLEVEAESARGGLASGNAQLRDLQKENQRLVKEAQENANKSRHAQEAARDAAMKRERELEADKRALEARVHAEEAAHRRVAEELSAAKQENKNMEHKLAAANAAAASASASAPIGSAANKRSRVSEAADPEKAKAARSSSNRFSAVFQPAIADDANDFNDDGAMDDQGGDDGQADESDDEPQRAPAKAHHGAQRDDLDPNTLSVAQLKSRLTELNYILPFAEQKKTKAFYVDLIFKLEPHLKGQYGGAPAKSAKKSAKK